MRSCGCEAEDRKFFVLRPWLILGLKDLMKSVSKSKSRFLVRARMKNFIV